jgi:hypothetical protein
MARDDLGRYLASKGACVKVSPQSVSDLSFIKSDTLFV